MQEIQNDQNVLPPFSKLHSVMEKCPLQKEFESATLSPWNRMALLLAGPVTERYKKINLDSI